ncbi:MAG: class I SAM-dependent methyltransferase [Sandaracinaceae bacterium]
MRRLDVIELEDLSACPRAIRDGGTDWLRFAAEFTGAFDPVAPKLRAAMDAGGVDRIVDLCSGGGGPWNRLEPVLRQSGDVEVTLTDLYPNEDALAHARARSGGRLKTRLEPTDATDVPASLPGVRTLFNGFHHFNPAQARAILADAVDKRQPIAIFEGFHHRALGMLMVWSQVPLVWLLTPLVRPFSLTRLLLTYVVPAIPFIVWFDGTMSMLRLYLKDELREMVESIDGHASFDWDIGTTKIPGVPLGHLTHLVGTPRALSNDD